MEYQKENIGFFMWLLCRASCLPTISPQTPEVTARCADVRLKRSRKIGARPVSAFNWFCDYFINWRNWNLWMWNKLFKRNVNLDPPLDLSRKFGARGQRWREEKRLRLRNPFKIWLQRKMIDSLCFRNKY